MVRSILYYNLDLVLSVGYKVNLYQATKFRQWATKILKKLLIDGFAINQKLLKNKQDQIEEMRKTFDLLAKSAKNLDVSDQFQNQIT